MIGSLSKVNKNQGFVATFSGSLGDAIQQNLKTKDYSRENDIVFTQDDSNQQLSSVLTRNRENNHSNFTNFRGSYNNAQQDISAIRIDYQTEIMNLKNRLDNFRIEYESQKRSFYEIELEHQAKERDMNQQLRESQMKNKMNEEKIKKLEEEVIFERSQNKILSNEFNRQRSVWNDLYNDICKEMHGMKQEMEYYKPQVHQNFKEKF